MAHVTIELSATEVRALKLRTGKRSIDSALRAWVANANPKHSVEQLKAALSQSTKEEAAGKGRKFKSGREALKWLES